MSYFVVTTCSAEGWRDYGQRMVESFLHRWDDDIHLFIYVEDFEVPDHPRLHEMRFPRWFIKWRSDLRDVKDAHGLDVRRNRRRRFYDYRRDCVRFSHKVAAFTDIGADADPADIMIVLDADTFSHAPVTSEWLDELRGNSEYMSWLDRERTYPECGFVMYNCGHPRHIDFMNAFAELYRSGRVFTEISETHDSFVLQQFYIRCRNQGWFRTMPGSLSGPEGRRSGHPFVMGPLGAKLDHMKGKFKARGRTPREFVSKARRQEEYWR